MKHWQRWLMAALVGLALAAALSLIASGGQDSLAADGTIYVDADAVGANNGTSWENAFTNLQLALDEASSGDEIWVAAGTYMPSYLFSPGDPRSATFQMKNGVALYGGFDPSVGDVGWEDRDWVNNVTTLSGDIGTPGNMGDNSYHVIFHPSGLALDGFTVSGGNANAGSFPHNAGGGMYNYDHNSPTVTNCTFSGNSASGDGGGMYNRWLSSPVLTNCTFSGNSAGSYGGGMSNNDNSYPTLTNCTFQGNSAQDGGGLSNYVSSKSTLTNCAFLGNSATYGGGMSSRYSSSAALTNCTFSGNSATYGGGMYNSSSLTSLTNCTFSGNSAGSDGGGMYNDGYSPTVTNCILWGDSPGEISGGANVSYSDIQGGYEGTGNIDADPLFVDLNGGNFHLGQGSPCIDAATNDAPNLPRYDFEGDLRVMDGDLDGAAIVDMGIDEVVGPPPAVIYVDHDAAGSNDGTSWVNAFINLQDALARAVDGAEIWVAAGTYTPTQEFSPGDPRSATFQLENGVALYGGFDPTVGDVGWEDRDWVNNITTLSGDLNGDDGPSFANNGENSYHVIFHPSGLALDATAVLDGFTVSGGNANTRSFPHNVGGGMYNDGSSPVVTNCTFSGNSAPVGGGMYNRYSSLVVANCAFSGNSGTQWGGGMYNSNSSPAVINCTFSGNSAGGSGGGMYNSNSSPAVTNCILWGDSPNEISGGANVSYSDIQGGYEGTGNIDADPLFVDLSGGNYHLGRGSPCVDAGTNDAPNLPDYDFEGDPRVMDGNGDGTAIVDMGSDEIGPYFIFVDQEATGNNDGTSWENAYNTLQPALEDARGGIEIRVAAGTYTPTQELSPGEPRSATFQLKNGVALYGGFDPSVGDVGWQDRDWVSNVTILSGDIGTAGDPSDNSYHVFYHPSELALDVTAIVDGFTVSDGNADADSAPNDHGGGMFNDGSSPTLTNCTFSGNSADEGGGMYNEYSSPVVTNCAFLGNSEGGMGNEYSSPVVTNCTFSGNSAGAGSGMHNNHSSPVVTGCIFSGNTAALGAGMSNHNASSPTVSNCTFSDNTAYEGGGMFSYESSPTVTNCTFSGNSAHAGGGMYNYDSSPTVTNCTFSGNAVTTGGGIYNRDSSPTVTNCILWGDHPDEISNTGWSSMAAVTYSDIQGSYWGDGNIDEDPLFVDPANGDLHLLRGSPCIDAGSNSPPGGLPDYDFEGDTRVLDGNGDGMAVVDMGIDEALGIPGVIYVDQDAAGDNNGTSWQDAYTTLQPALEDAAAGEEIWVAEGTYTPTYLSSPGDPRSATFQLINGVALYGGFDPTVGDLGWRHRDWVNNVTILSGDIGTAGDPGDNSYHVFYHPPELALDGSAILDGFTVSGGNASSVSATHDNGGGMYNDSSSPTVINCTFWGNSADWQGGGMYNDGSSPSVTNCTFSGNSATWAGGGMYNYDSSPVVANCTLLGNSAFNGGGMFIANSSPTLTNCTFSGNSASGSGGGMLSAGSTPAVTNCILWGDSPDEIYSAYNGPVVAYSDIQGGYSGNGNIDADPLFVDPSTGDYHLGPSSPCIDAGTNDAPNLPDYDFEGDPRVMDGDGNRTAIVDIGIDEALAIYPAVIYVDRDAAGENNGTSWEDALTDLQDALAWAVDGIEIWVAEGIYTPAQEFSPGDPRSATFQLKNGVALYGGFDPSVGDVDWQDRDWVSNVTTLSGDIGTEDDPGDNGYHVFYHPRKLALDTSAVLDGFTVTGGNANGGSHDDAGGGMYNVGSSPSVTNCTFSDNSATWAGGGMYNYDSSPVVANCTLLGNSAGGNGGGMYYSGYSSPVVTNCTFSGNSAGLGGGMHTNNLSSPVTNCTFSGNSASSSGGGMFNSYSRPAVINCTFSNNSAGYRGGGMHNHGSSPVVTNCTFSGNSASSSGGGMHNFAESSPKVTNCTFSGNSAGLGGGMHNYYDSSPAVTNCILWDDTPQEIYNYDGDSIPVVTYSDIQGGYEGEGNIDEDPLFVDPAVGDYHLGPGSPCIDAGTNNAPNLPDHDFEGDPRVMDGDGDGTAVVDMGIDEVAGYVLYLPLVFRGY